MKKHIIIENYFWFIKLISAIVIFALTIKFAGPLSYFIIQGCENTFSKFSIIKNLSNDELLINNNDNRNLDEVTLLSDKQADNNENNKQNNNNKKNAKEYETPNDVLLMEKDYISTFASGYKKGEVEEVFFKTSGATDIIGNVAIKNATATKKPDFKSLLEMGAPLEINNKTEPVVLIFHTHTTESYLLSDTGAFYDGYETRSKNENQNMVRIGNEICTVLKSKGIGYIHDKNIYDESYNGAYARSRESVLKYLEEYPSIKIVLDVHRDAIYYSDTSHCKPTAEINGKKAAQIMIITGAEEGYVSDFPNWEKNLAFALCFQKTAQNKFNGLMKPIYFCQRKYNMDTAFCSLLLEIGSDANTLDEALYSANMAGHTLAEIIDTYCTTEVFG